MAKTEKIFELLSYIRQYPHLSAKDLAALCEISERGVYRYLNTLQRAGVGVALEDGYVLRQVPLTQGFRCSELESVCELLNVSIKACRDPRRRADGEKYLSNLREQVQACQTEIQSPVVVIHPSKPSPINPAVTHDTISANLMSLVFSSLVKLSDAGEMVSDLAGRWSVSSDGSIWRFHLREAFFSDQTPVSASDVAATYERLRTSPVRALRRKYGVIDCIDASGDTVTIRLKHAYGPCLWDRAIGKKACLGDSEAVIGSGPFIARRQENDIILTANEAYYGHVPELREVVFKYISNAAEALHLMTDGEPDLVIDLVSPDIVYSGFRTHPVLDGTVYAILFDNEELGIAGRRGIEHALSKSSLLGKSELSYVPHGPFAAKWANSPDIKPRYRNVEIARALLGTTKQLVLAVTDSAAQLMKVAVGIKVQLMKAGVKVSLVSMDDSHDAVLCRLLMGPDPDELGKSISAYSELPCNELWRAARSSPARGERQAAYQAIHRIMHDKCLAIFLVAGYNYVTSRYDIDTRRLTLMDLISGLKDWRVSSASEARHKSPVRNYEL